MWNWVFFLVKNKRVLWQHSTSFPSHLAKHLFQYILQLLIDSQNLPISVFYLGSGQRNIDIIYSWKTSIILLGSKEISIYEFINLYIYFINYTGGVFLKKLHITFTIFDQIEFFLSFCKIYLDYNYYSVLVIEIFLEKYFLTKFNFLKLVFNRLVQYCHCYYIEHYC